VKLPVIGDPRDIMDNLSDAAGSFRTPVVRLGVTGLARAGKTVFITALVHNLIHGGRLPVFEPWRSERLIGAELKPQVHDDVPTFDYRAHVRDLVDKRIWPDSTRSISEMRLTIAYESATFLGRNLGSGRLHLDIVDYPGEWLLDLSLLSKDFDTWSRETVAQAREPGRADVAAPWLAALAGFDANAREDDERAAEAARLFTAYLKACQSRGAAFSTVPPGRFLMPGDLEGSPALTFAPLDLPLDGAPPRGSLWAMMERRFESYKQLVVQPFFRNHFARLDRQIVLVDVLEALNAGPAAMADLETALADILGAFRPGRASWLASILFRRIDRILFAATKADHLHQSSHDRLEAILKRLLGRAIARAKFAGAAVEVRAIAAVRATREGTVREGGELLPCIVGTPQRGEAIDGTVYDGSEEIALFPGDLPKNPSVLFREVQASLAAAQDSNPEKPASAPDIDASLVPDLRFLKFRPPRLETTAEGATLSLPHIRLDRALDFLIGDKLR
jgi:predicted YcjX-like family ATPase